MRFIPEWAFRGKTMSWVLLMTIYVAIGSTAGMVGGMLGTGGSVVTVPCLLFMFKYLGFPQAYVMHMAVATSLSAMIFNSAGSTWAHHRRKSVHWDLFRKLVPGFVIGGVLGAVVATWISGVLLEIFFGVLLCVMAVRFYFQKSVPEAVHNIPSPLVLNGICGGIGALSNLLGIGGGSMTVPLLTAFRVQDKKAIATSAAASLVTTILGAATYLWLGWDKVPVQGTVGLIDLPAFLVVGATAFFVAPVGVALTHRIDPAKVRRIFAFVLALTGLLLIF